MIKWRIEFRYYSIIPAGDKPALFTMCMEIDHAFFTCTKKKLKKNSVHEKKH